MRKRRAASGEASTSNSSLRRARARARRSPTTSSTTRSGNIEVERGGLKSAPATLLLLLWLVDVRGLAEEDLGRFHHRLREGRMRVDRQLHVRCGGAHLDGEHAFGNQPAGA